MKTLGNERLNLKSECKDKIKLYKRLKIKTVISGRPEMTGNNRKRPEKIVMKKPPNYRNKFSYHVTKVDDHLIECSISIGRLVGVHIF